VLHLQGKAAATAQLRSACHAEGRGFESHQPLRSPCKSPLLSNRRPSPQHAEGPGFEFHHHLAAKSLQIGVFGSSDSHPGHQRTTGPRFRGHFGDRTSAHKRRRRRRGRPARGRSLTQKRWRARRSPPRRPLSCEAASAGTISLVPMPRPGMTTLPTASARTPVRAADGACASQPANGKPPRRHATRATAADRQANPGVEGELECRTASAGPPPHTGRTEPRCCAGSAEPSGPTARREPPRRADRAVRRVRSTPTHESQRSSRPAHPCHTNQATPDKPPEHPIPAGPRG
jgi:hypothetical protein